MLPTPISARTQLDWSTDNATTMARQSGKSRRGAQAFRVSLLITSAPEEVIIAGVERAGSVNEVSRSAFRRAQRPATNYREEVIMRGSGKADVFVMLAHPVGHAKSPGIFNEIFQQKGLDSLMVPLSCRPEDFDTFWAGLTAAENIKGVIVSVPYKIATFHKALASHERAARVQSANSLRRQADGSWYADNFDGVGFIDALKAGGHDIAGRRVLQVGAGGAGASISYCLAEAGAAEIRINDVDRRCAADLASLVEKAIPACRITTGDADPSGMDMAVNATPAGMHPGDPLPLDASRLTPEMTVVDIIMEPAETALLRFAREKGCRIQFGRPMMDFQVKAMSDFFDIDRKERSNG
jgi:shikimate dehydrogenase